MGIASSTSSTSCASPSTSLHHRLGRWVRKICHHFRSKKTGVCCTPMEMPPQTRTESGEQNRHDLNQVAAKHPCAGPHNQRPLRANWPFIAKPPLHTPEGATQLPPDRHDGFSASAAIQLASRSPAKVMRRAYDAGTCQLVIAGRMADVCAELERMVAMEVRLGYGVAGIEPATSNVA